MNLTQKNTFNAVSLALLVSICLTACIPSQQWISPSSTEIRRTSSVLDNIITKGEINVGTTGDFMPFSYQFPISETDFYGVDIELAKDLAKSLGVELKLVKTSWPTMIEDLKSGKYDICMSGVTIKLDRQKVGLFSIPVLTSGKAAITRDELADVLTSIEAINQEGIKVIVNPGGTNEAFARANFPKATIIQNDENLTIFQKIVDGVADVMVTDAVETLIQELIHPELEAVNPDNPFNFFEMGYLLPRDHTFKAYVDQWLNLRQKEGKYQEIFDAELEKIKKL